MKELPKPILHALKKAKISPALSTDFSQFLNQYPDSESHTLYLLNDKKQKIEEVVQELYGVPIILLLMSGNIYTFIRIQPFVDENFKQQFCWSFNKAKYGKKGWHMEKSIKNIKTDLIHNKHKPGKNIETYL